MPPLLGVRGISKSFPGVRALSDVSLHLECGELLAVVGENGAGKSTLMKCVAGLLQPDSGTIEIAGQFVAPRSVKDAERLGIVLIHQELNLAGQLDIAGNMFLGREPTVAGPLGIIDKHRLHREAARVAQRLGLLADTRTMVCDLSIGQQQLVEIARALSLSSRILILDEPTSSLTENETTRLFEVLRELKQQGIGILYISHRLKEVEMMADRVTVLRDGRNAGELQRGQIRHDGIVQLMVGRELKQFFHRNRHAETLPAPPSKSAVLQVRDLRWSPTQRGLSFSIAAGEIVGMAGLIGSGRTELAQTLFGARRILNGAVLIDGKPVPLRQPADAIRAGIYLIPEDRRIEGLILADSVKNNISIASLNRLSVFGILRPGPERALAQALCERFKIRSPSIDQMVANLSGGNQQKVVLAKWLSKSPRVLILDEPTRGIDVGAKSEVYALMDEIARQGTALLMISSDLEEILGMSDRVIVMHEGSLAGEVAGRAISENSIMHLATGGT